MAIDYNKEIKRASADMGQASKTAHNALDEIKQMDLSNLDFEDLNHILQEIEVAKSALREMRTARNQLVAWAEITIERLNLAQLKK